MVGNGAGSSRSDGSPSTASSRVVGGASRSVAEVVDGVVVVVVVVELVVVDSEATVNATDASVVLGPWWQRTTTGSLPAASCGTVSTEENVSPGCRTVFSTPPMAISSRCRASHPSPETVTTSPGRPVVGSTDATSAGKGRTVKVTLPD